MDSEGDARPNIANLQSIAVRTRSPSDLRRFYEAIGLAVTGRDGVLDDDYVTIDLGAVTMIARPASPFQPAEAGLDLVVSVDDPQKRIEEALSLLSPGERIGRTAAANVVLTDPDGRRVRLVPNGHPHSTHER